MKKSTDRWEIQSIFFKKRFSIRQKVQRLIFICSIVSFVTVSIIALVGMFTARQNSVTDGLQMGERAAEITVTKLEDAEKRRISLLANAQAQTVGLQLDWTEYNVRLLSAWVSYILDNPNDYSPQSISFPKAENAGIVTAQLELAPNVNYNDLVNDIELLANVKDLMVIITNAGGEGTVVALGDETGFYFSADSESDKHLTADGNPITFDARTRPWYKMAQAKDDFVYTGIYKDLYSGKLRLGGAMPYYRNNKFSGVVDISYYLSDVDEADLQSENDTFFIVDSEGKLIFLKDAAHIFSDMDMTLGQTNMLETGNDELTETTKAMIASKEEIKSISVNGKDYFIAFSPISKLGWSVAAVIGVEDIIATREKARQEVLSIAESNVDDMDSFITRLIVVMIVVIIISVWVLRKIGDNMGSRFAKPILELSDGVREIASGNLDKKLGIKTGDEIEHLSICFDAMTDELKKYIANLSRVTAEKEKAAAELNIAKNIQVGALPQDFLVGRKEFQLYATMNAAKGVGGDFYDFYLLDDNHLVVTIADVSGKGIPAALYMMRAKTTLKNLVIMANNPDDFAAVMMLVNQELCRENETMMFVTVFFAQLNLTTGELIYVNAGHNSPLVRENGKFRYLVQKKKYLMLGAEEDATYEAHRITLQPNDMLFLYTDGVTEAMNNDKKLYSEERLEETLNHIDGSLSVQEILAEVRKDIDAHADGAEQSDDITMLGVKFLGKPHL